MGRVGIIEGKTGTDLFSGKLSYPARLGMVPCDWLDEAETFRSLDGSHQLRAEAYRRFVECEGGSKSDELIASAVNSNKLTGGGKFIGEIDRRMGVRVEMRKPGRPASGK